MNLTLTVPAIVWEAWAWPGSIVASLFGATWLFLWVANRPLPRRATLMILGLLGVWGLGAMGLQLVRGGTETITMLPAQISAANPLFVMIVIPLLNVLVYRPLERRGRPLLPLHRDGHRDVLQSLAFVTVAILQTRIDAAGRGEMHVLWQIIPYFILTTAEVLVSVTGLEFAYTQAPRAMKSTIMGFWLLTFSFGNMLVAFLAPLQAFSLATFFWIFAGLMVVAAAVFVVLASRYQGKTYLQQN
jgi:POT family proton-dependent oligopeptide transporter